MAAQIRFEASLAREHNIQSALVGSIVPILCRHVFQSGWQAITGSSSPILKSYPSVVLGSGEEEDIGLIMANFTKETAITVTVPEALGEPAQSPLPEEAQEPWAFWAILILPCLLAFFLELEEMWPKSSTPSELTTSEVITIVDEPEVAVKLTASKILTITQEEGANQLTASKILTIIHEEAATELSTSEIFTIINKVAPDCKLPNLKYRKGILPLCWPKNITHDLDYDEILNSSFKLRLVTMSFPCDFPSHDIFIKRYGQALGGLRNDEWSIIHYSSDTPEERVKQAMRAWKLCLVKDANGNQDEAKTVVEDAAFLKFSAERVRYLNRHTSIKVTSSHSIKTSQLPQVQGGSTVNTPKNVESTESTVVAPHGPKATAVRSIDNNTSAKSSRLATASSQSAVKPMASTTAIDPTRPVQHNTEPEEHPSQSTKTARSAPTQQPFQAASSLIAIKKAASEKARTLDIQAVTAPSQVPESASGLESSRWAQKTNTPQPGASARGPDVSRQATNSVSSVVQSNTSDQPSSRGVNQGGYRNRGNRGRGRGSLWQDRNRWTQGGQGNTQPQ